MHACTLGRTGLTVSRVGLGAGSIGDPAQDERALERLLEGALDRGVRLLDTARSYGLSEERIGRILAPRRDAFVLTTKVGYGIEGHADWTSSCVRAGIDAALTRLRTDRLDVAFLHSCSLAVLERGDVVEALREGVHAGKVRAAGYSGEGDALEWAVRSGAFEVVQASVNLVDQRSLEGALAEAHARGVGVIAKRPLANAPWRSDERPRSPELATYWERWRAMGLGAMRGPLAHGELALRFAAFQRPVSSAILGTTALEHLEQALAWAARGPLDNALAEALRSAFMRHDRGWHGVV